MIFSRESNVDPLGSYGGHTDTETGVAPSKSLHYWSRVRLQRWNIAFRVLTLALTVGAFFSIFFASSTGDHGNYSDWEATYSTFSSYQFLLYVDAVVCVYAFVLSTLGVLMVVISKIRATPTFLTIPIVVINLTACIFLLLAISAAMATDTITRRGWKFTKDGYTAAQSWKLCDTYGKFCTTIELGLAFTAVAVLTLAASTGVECYCNRFD